MASSEADLYSKAMSDGDASIRLGGITLYAPSDRILKAAIQRASEVICLHSAAHLTLTRVNLRSKVRCDLAEAQDDRIFSALLGLQLRLGHIDVITCAASSGRSYQVLVHESRFPQLEQNLEAASACLERNRVLTVKDLEKTLFGTRLWGTWSSTSHILAHLVFRGTAIYLDTMSFFSTVSELDNAFD